MPKKILDENKLKRFYCKSISSSIGNIIRFSTNEIFRKKTFKLFNVLGTKNVEKEIQKRLIKILAGSRKKKDGVVGSINYFY